MLSIIVATSNNNAIGKDNKLLWKLPNDMKFFKNTTWGNPIIMGRKTFESIGNKPLPGRCNIVLSNQSLELSNEVLQAKSIDEALSLAKAENTTEIMIIGGAEIYKQLMPQCQRIYLTKVDVEIEGDAYFEKINTDEWHLVASQPHSKDEKHAYDYCFEVWERKTN